MAFEKIIAELRSMRAVYPERRAVAGRASRFEFSGEPQIRKAHKGRLVNTAIEELGGLVLAVSDEPLDADELRPLGLGVMSQSPFLCYVDHVVDFEAFYNAAYLEIGYWRLFHPAGDDSVSRFLAATAQELEPDNVIRSGIADFFIVADVDDDAWTVALAPPARPSTKPPA